MAAAAELWASDLRCGLGCLETRADAPEAEAAAPAPGGGAQVFELKDGSTVALERLTRALWDTVHRGGADSAFGACVVLQGDPGLVAAAVLAWALRNGTSAPRALEAMSAKGLEPADATAVRAFFGRGKQHGVFRPASAPAARFSAPRRAERRVWGIDTERLRELAEEKHITLDAVHLLQSEDSEEKLLAVACRRGDAELQVFYLSAEDAAAARAEAGPLSVEAPGGGRWELPPGEAPGKGRATILADQLDRHFALLLPAACSTDKLRTQTN